jgi:hypothetical protein
MQETGVVHNFSNYIVSNQFTWGGILEAPAPMILELRRAFRPSCGKMPLFFNFEVFTSIYKQLCISLVSRGMRVK